MTESVDVRVAGRLAAASEQVFDAWLDADVARRWLFATATRPLAHATIDARIGGTFAFVDDGDEPHAYAGRYVEIDRGRRLAFTLTLPQRAGVVTFVAVDIAPQPRGCRVALRHENVPSDIAQQVKARWTGILYGLDETVGQ